MYLAAGILFLLLSGSAYSYMCSRQETRQKQELFYSEILPQIKEAVVKEDRNSFPSLEGFYKNLQLKVVPYIDNLGLRRLPRLYARVYIMVENRQIYRIVKTSERKHLFTLAGSESHCEIDSANIVKILAEIENCYEVIMQKTFIRATLLLAKGDKGYYAVLRAARFPVLILKKDRFEKTVNLLLRLREEVAGIEQAT